MGDIEDLFVPSAEKSFCLGVHRCSATGSARGPTAKKPANRRMENLRRHLSERKSKHCSICPHVTSASTGKPFGDWMPEDVSSLPVRNPYGAALTIKRLTEIRSEESGPIKMMISAIEKGEIPAPDSRAKLILTGEYGKWPYCGKRMVRNIAPWLLNNPEVDAIAGPILRRFVANMKQGTTDMPYPPTVVIFHLPSP